MGSTAPQRRLYVLDAGFSDTPYHGRILSLATDGTDQYTLIDALGTLPDGVTIDREHNHLYWTNMGTSFSKPTGSIERIDLPYGHNRTVIIPAGTVGVHTPKQITLAPRSRKLYWCDREGMKVMRANLDGTDVEVLVDTGSSDEDRKDLTRWCVGIAVDEPRGVFYWSQKGPSKGKQGRIFRAKIETPPGADVRARPDVEVVFENLPEPIDLEMDEDSQTLYWTDRGDPPAGNTLNRAAVGMKGEVQVLARRLHETIGLALDVEGDVVYVTDLAGGVYAVDVKTRTKKVLVPELGDITGIALA